MKKRSTSAEQRDNVPGRDFDGSTTQISVQLYSQRGQLVREFDLDPARQATDLQTAEQWMRDNIEDYAAGHITIVLTEFTLTTMSQLQMTLSEEVPLVA